MADQVLAFKSRLQARLFARHIGLNAGLSSCWILALLCLNFLPERLDLLALCFDHTEQLPPQILSRVSYHKNARKVLSALASRAVAPCSEYPLRVLRLTKPSPEKNNRCSQAKQRRSGLTLSICVS